MNLELENLFKNAGMTWVTYTLYRNKDRSLSMTVEHESDEVKICVKDCFVNSFDNFLKVAYDEQELIGKMCYQRYRNKIAQITRINDDVYFESINDYDYPNTISEIAEEVCNKIGFSYEDNEERWIDIVIYYVKLLRNYSFNLDYDFRVTSDLEKDVSEFIYDIFKRSGVAK